MYDKQTLTLTSAQILASNTTAISILPAKAGFAYIVKQILTSWNSGTTQYADNTSLNLQVGASGDTVGTIDLSALPAATGNIEVDVPVGYTAIENTALLLKAGTGDPTTGNISVDVTVIYEIVQS